MRIAYDNLIDGIAQANVTALTEETLFEGYKVQDQVLAIRWRSTTPTSQTLIFDASAQNITGGYPGRITGAEVTNLVSDPNNMTATSWTAVNATITTADTIVGKPAYKVLSGSASAAYAESASMAAGSSDQHSAIVVVRKDSTETARVIVRNASSSTNLARADIVFSSKTVTMATGAASMTHEWIDDATVRVFIKPDTAATGNSIIFRLYADDSNGTAQSTIFSAPMFADKVSPVPFVSGTRNAVDLSYETKMPPGSKFIVDCEFFPYWSYDGAANKIIWTWRNTSSIKLELFYLASDDKIKIRWRNAGTSAALESTAFDDGTLKTINQKIRVVASIDLSEAGVTTGSRLFIIPRSQGSFEEVSAWDSAIDDRDDTVFNTFAVASDGSSSNYAQGVFRHVKIYGGVLPTDKTITTEAELDAALEDRKLTYEQTYQNRFNFDTVALMGHNISEEAKVVVEANDWNEWNYTDGSGSSIIQHALTWDESTILKMITKIKRQYVRFTINDPNNDDGIIKVGRAWVGPYLDIDPTSLDDFSVTKARSDRVVYGLHRHKFADSGAGWRRLELRFPVTPTTMTTAIQTLYDTVGNHKSFIFCNFDTIRDYKIVEPCYVSIVGDMQFRHRGRQRYEYRLAMEEDR